MSTSIFTVPSGVTQILPAPALSSICFQPVAGGSATVAYGPDGVSPVFQAVVQSGNTSPFSFCPSTYAGVGGAAFSANPMGQLGKVQVTAAGGQNCTVIISDLQQYPGSFPERQTVAQSAVAYTMPNSTSELELFSIRFPAGFFKLNFRAEMYYQITCTNSVNVKTLKGYFGPSTNSATAGAIETGASAMTTQVYTSMAGGYGTFAAAGRNDGATIIGSNVGLTSAGGWGSSTTANVSVTSAAYQTSEQVMLLTGTKATGSETFTLDAVVVKIYQ